MQRTFRARVYPHCPQEGADGVFIGGCHPGDSHYNEGNYKTVKRFNLTKRVLAEMSIEPERVQLGGFQVRKASVFLKQ